MVPRLRSLCLEKVNNNIDEVDYQTIPKELARDLQLSKLFNGNFAYDDTFGLHQFGLDACALNIFYDGETWTFTYRSENNELYWYHPIGEFRPRLRKFTLTEGSPASLTTPFPEMKFMTNNYLMNPNIKMKMKAIVKNNGRYGRLVFENSTMKSVWHMTLARGTRVLEHRGTIRYYHQTSSPINRDISSKLLETTDTPEHAFQNLAELTIEEEIMVEEEIRRDAIFIDESVRYRPEVDDELEDVGTFESAVGFSYSKWAECEYQMNDGCLRDFWEMTERNYAHLAIIPALGRKPLYQR